MNRRERKLRQKQLMKDIEIADHRARVEAEKLFLGGFGTEEVIGILQRRLMVPPEPAEMIAKEVSMSLYGYHVVSRKDEIKSIMPILAVILAVVIVLVVGLFLFLGAIAN